MAIHPTLILLQINKDLTKHPGDAPWGCVDCYHGHPCIEKEILLAAKREILRAIDECEDATCAE